MKMTYNKPYEKEAMVWKNSLTKKNLGIQIFNLL